MTIKIIDKDIEYKEEKTDKNVTYLIVTPEEYTFSLNFENYPKLQQLLILSELTDDGNEELEVLKIVHPEICILQKKINLTTREFILYVNGPLKFEIDNVDFEFNDELIRELYLKNTNDFPVELFPNLKDIEIFSDIFNSKLDFSECKHLENLIIKSSSFNKPLDLTANRNLYMLKLVASSFDQKIYFPEQCPKLSVVYTSDTKMKKPLTLYNCEKLNYISLHQSKLVLKDNIPNLNFISVGPNYPYDIASLISEFGLSLRRLIIDQGYKPKKLDLYPFKNLEEITMTNNYDTEIQIDSDSVSIFYDSYDKMKKYLCNLKDHHGQHVHNGPHIQSGVKIAINKVVKEDKTSRVSKIFQIGDIVQPFLPGTANRPNMSHAEYKKLYPDLFKSYFKKTKKSKSKKKSK